MIEYRYCAETVYFGDGPAMVCSREVVEDHCPKHGHQPRSHVDEKRTAMIAAAESRGRSAGYAEAVAKLRGAEEETNYWNDFEDAADYLEASTPTTEEPHA